MTTIETAAPVSPGALVPAAAPTSERRDVFVERRQRPTPMLSRYTFFGGRRRANGRRFGENANTFVDVHGSGLFLVVLAVVALNFLDAWFTIFFLSHGGEELNPFMLWLLEAGTLPFVLVKSAGIGLCVAVLTVSKNFAYARLGLGVVLVGYLALLGWHLWLYSHIA